MPKFFVLICGLAFLSFPVYADDSAVYRDAYDFARQTYVEPLTYEQIAVKTLQGLHEVDNRLRVADDSVRLTLYYQARVVRSFTKPDPDDRDAWLALTGEVIAAAKKISPQAKRRDFDIPDLTLAALIKSLDSDSKYYLSPEDHRQNLPLHRRNYAERRIDDILYLKIVAFNNYTLASAKETLQNNRTAKGIILDLRGSPGGLLSAAVDIADLFLDGGIIVSVQGRSEKPVRFYNSKEGNELSKAPMVVLIDGETASAAEVLAAALQDQGRAKVVGTLSFGKGSIQELELLPNNSEMALTTAYFYTPSGRRLHRQGVIPDICTAFYPDGKDVKRLLGYKPDYPCEKEARETAELDIEIARALLNRD